MHVIGFEMYLEDTATLQYRKTVEMSSQSSWKLEGDYFEGCNCDIVCPCVFLSNPTEGNCHVTCAWHIQKGNYGNTDLSNLNVVALFNTPGNMATGPKWKAALVYRRKSDTRTKRF